MLQLLLLLAAVSMGGARKNDLTSRLVKQIDNIADVLGEKPSIVPRVRGEG